MGLAFAEPNLTALLAPVARMLRVLQLEGEITAERFEKSDEVPMLASDLRTLAAETRTMADEFQPGIAKVRELLARLESATIEQLDDDSGRKALALLNMTLMAMSDVADRAEAFLARVQRLASRRVVAKFPELATAAGELVAAHDAVRTAAHELVELIEQAIDETEAIISEASSTEAEFVAWGTIKHEIGL